MPFQNHSSTTWRQSSSSEVYFRWNEAFYPWRKAPTKFHLNIKNPTMVGFRDKKKTLAEDKFTIVVTTYRRLHSLVDLLKGYAGVKKLDRVRRTDHDIYSYCIASSMRNTSGQKYLRTTF
jgi:hypothetical protein